MRLEISSLYLCNSSVKYFVKNAKAEKKRVCLSVYAALWTDVY